METVIDTIQSIHGIVVRNATTITRRHGQMTMPYHAMMVKPAPEMTTALMEDALVLHSPAYHVKSVTMMHVLLNRDIVQSLWEG